MVFRYQVAFKRGTRETKRDTGGNSKDVPGRDSRGTR